MNAATCRPTFAGLLVATVLACPASAWAQASGVPDGEAAVPAAAPRVATATAAYPPPLEDVGRASGAEQSSSGGLAPRQSWIDWQRMTGDWARLRSRLDEAGVSLSMWSVSDVSGLGGTAGSGGSLVGRGLMNLDATFDLERLAGIRGGSVYAQYFGVVGRNGSERLDVYQAFSNIDADQFHRVGELWYEQWSAGRHLRLKVGRVDANTEFARVENGSEFINASMGYSPTISVLPTYPTPAWSANLFVYPTRRLYVGVGAYARRPGDGDGDEDDLEVARRAFLIGEAGVRWTLPGGRLRGRLGVGAWYEPETWRALDGSRQRFQPAPFVVFDHDLWRGLSVGDEEESGVGLFAQFGSAAPGQGEAVRHVGLGVRWNGPLSGRDDDVAGFGITAVDFSPLCPDRRGREVSFGPFYKWQAAGWLEVKPDLQFVRNAGGARAQSYSPVFTLRLRVEM